ncbi:MAG: hypothetical protein U9O78_04980 [Patescibacteria group bacterium]|nr:hypothetical protein [Patescibacteria group bacterium]
MREKFQLTTGVLVEHKPILPLSESLQEKPPYVVWGSELDADRIVNSPAFQELLKRDLIPIIVVLEEGEQISQIEGDAGTAEDTYLILQTYNLVDLKKESMDGSVTGCTVDYNRQLVVCLSGDDLTRYLGEDELGRIEKQIATNLKNRWSITDVAVDSFKLILTQIEAVEKADAERVQVSPTAATKLPDLLTPTPYLAQPPKEPPTEVAFIEEHQSEIVVFVGFLFIAIVATIVETTYFRPHRQSIRETTQAKNMLVKLRDEIEQLTRRGGGYAAFGSLISLLRSSYPKLAAQCEQDKAAFDQQYNRAMAVAEQQLAIKFGYFTPKSEMTELAVGMCGLMTTITALIKQLEDLQGELVGVEARAEAATANLDKARDDVREAKEWYQAQTAESRRLPNEEVIFATFDNQFERARNAIYTQDAGLRGSDFASEISIALVEFKAAVEKVLAVEREIATAAQRNVRILKKIKLAEQPRVEAIASEGDNHFDAAVNNLSAGLEFEAVFSNLIIARREYASVQSYLINLADSISQRDNNRKRVQAIESQGYRVTDLVSTNRQEMTSLLAQANRAAANCNWSEAGGYLGELVAISQQTYQEMQSLVDLSQSNEHELMRLKDRARIAENRSKGDIQSKWEKLRDNYQPRNYTGFENHFVQITAGLETLFDEDEDLDAGIMADQAENLNSMEVQEFRRARAVIVQIDRKLTRIDGLMDELEVRHDLVLKAELECGQGIKLAKKRLEAAKQAREVDDRLVDETVDKAIREVEGLIAEAQAEKVDKVYVIALDLAGKASQKAVEAKTSADEQIKHIRDLYEQLEQAEDQATDQVALAIKDVDKEEDEVVATQTLNLAKQAEHVLETTLVLVSNLAKYEDHQLVKQIGEVITAFGKAEESAQETLTSLQKDQERHRQLFNQAKKAISKAKSAIRDASLECDDYRVGIAGSMLLSNARSTLPNTPSWGDSKVSIQAVISNAQDAERKAKEAKIAAAAAIAKHKAEEAAKKRREAAARATRISVSTSNSTTHPGMGSRGGGASISSPSMGNRGDGASF